ncbi:MAG: SAM-dependent methyltransferase [Proteobacteria bacterium]|nr:SAM-dependent methyltransferase [Pseudomonadota bacterium]
MPNSELDRLIAQAIASRSELIDRLHREDTDTYRIFHGINEGRAGLTVDRYGPQILVQTFYEPLGAQELVVVVERVRKGLGFEPWLVYRDRSAKKPDSTDSSRSRGGIEKPSAATDCREFGIRYTVDEGHRGRDPLLFLDLRAGRRFVMANSRNLSVLNLFAYTCGVGTCAAVGGARHVWNVDFAASSLEFGKKNMKLNRLAEDRIRFIQADFFPVVRQLADMPIKGRAKNRNYPKLDPLQFDLIVMDPPRWASSPFGAVDLVRDYQSLFKPVLLAAKPGGRILCTNHVPKVSLDDWLTVLQRCAAKAGRPIKNTEVIEPERDFPSPDGKHPLKIAVVEI